MVKQVQESALSLFSVIPLSQVFLFGFIAVGFYAQYTAFQTHTIDFEQSATEKLGIIREDFENLQQTLINQNTTVTSLQLEVVRLENEIKHLSEDVTNLSKKLEMLLSRREGIDYGP